MKALHVGCGHGRLPEVIFPWETWEEVRLDIDPEVMPDVVASMTEIPLEDASFEAVASQHNLEHLRPHDVPVALREFQRVLKPGGFVFIQVPDLGWAAREIAEGRGGDVAYEAPAGPVTAFDMVYGWAQATATNPYMAHHCGFTVETLKRLLEFVGFRDVTVRARDWNIDAVAVKHA